MIPLCTSIVTNHFQCPVIWYLAHKTSLQVFLFRSFPFHIHIMAFTHIPDHFIFKHLLWTSFTPYIFNKFIPLHCIHSISFIFHLILITSWFPPLANHCESNPFGLPLTFIGRGSFRFASVPNFWPLSFSRSIPLPPSYVLKQQDTNISNFTVKKIIWTSYATKCLNGVLIMTIHVMLNFSPE